MPAPGQLQNYLTVPGAVIETCAAPELQNFQVRANALVIQVVAGDGKHVELGILLVPLGKSLTIMLIERRAHPVPRQFLVAFRPEPPNLLFWITAEFHQLLYCGLNISGISLQCPMHKPSGGEGGYGNETCCGEEEIR